ncbi:MULTISPECIES: hypothetical protein [unclassified Ensifer]|uniref:hypothetical protein n=1 Tax=unclassified Ensifer TaxID=2633371 RepID=UPI00070F3951|nr:MULTISPECIES: hypothetical protein [unclassified Ensifer]KQW60421.1 hypothetical protein ASD02_26825 [Ensifer sp. Root1252]KRC77716.1 hypothetical protein ASE32_29120 [Ensifer sp. Root231]KRC99560.1 hypothetical protein ASE47_27730 [Ensifer sp. Root258]
MSIVDVEAMIAGSADTLIFPDMTLNNLGAKLGVPDRWNFAEEKPFGALLGYGDFEMMVWESRGKIEVRRVGLELWTAVDEAPKPKEKVRIAQRVKVRLGAFVPGLPFDGAILKLKEMNKRFRVVNYNDASEVKRIIFLGKNCKLVFFNMTGELRLAEIQFLSLRGDA